MASIVGRAGQLAKLPATFVKLWFLSTTHFEIWDILKIERQPVEFWEFPRFVHFAEFWQYLSRDISWTFCKMHELGIFLDFHGSRLGISEISEVAEFSHLSRQILQKWGSPIGVRFSWFRLSSIFENIFENVSYNGIHGDFDFWKFVKFLKIPDRRFNSAFFRHFLRRFSKNANGKYRTPSWVRF